MAIDQHLLNTVGDDVVVRFYRMTPPCVTIGRHQRWSRVIDADICRARGWDWVRRPTGGGALLHKHEINYAVVAPRGALAPTGRGEFRAAFERIGGALARAFECMGIESRLCSGGPKETIAQHGLCGRSVTGYEIAADGRKLVAAAQMITPTGVLQHGTIYLNAPTCTDRFWPATPASDSPDFVQRWTDLGPAFLGKPWTEITEALQDHFITHIGCDCRPYTSSPSDDPFIKAILDRWQAANWDRTR